MLLAAAGCTAPRPHEAEPAIEASAGLALPPADWRDAVDRAYRLVPADSRVVARIYRAGPLAGAGHNHTAATSDLAGCALVHRDGRTWISLRVPVASLEVDLPPDRRRAGEGFESDISPHDAEATRENLVSERVLNAARHPDIRFSGTLGADAQAVEGRLAIHGTVRKLSLPVEVTRDDDVRAAGSSSVRQTDFGIEPFSIFMGALQVADEVGIDYRLRFRRHAPAGACTADGG